MSKQKLFIANYKFNGNVDDVTFVEVDGAKVQVDENGQPKKDTEGKYIPFEEKKPDEGVPPKANDPEDIEALAKTNPAIARLLETTNDLTKKLTDYEAKEASKQEDEMKKKGEWQKLAEERGTKAETLQSQVTELKSTLAKYDKTLEGIVNSMKEQIPAEKLSLIPKNFTVRQQLEYITENAKLLGAMTVNNMGKIDESDQKPTLTDEAKLVNEIDELLKKSTRTASEDTLLYEKSAKLKELRKAKA